MESVDVGYLNLLKEVQTRGVVKPDRTGTGTLSLHGAHLQVDSSADHFPVLTTKKIHFRSVVGELLWFLSGDTNTRYLRDNRISIWDEWQRPYTIDGRDEVLVERRSKVPSAPYRGDFSCREYTAPAGSTDSRLLDTWVSMMRRCYDPTYPEYQQYGGSGTTVATVWHDPTTFLLDVGLLPHWRYKKNEWDAFELDSGYYGAQQYGPSTSVWLSPTEISTYMHCDDSTGKLLRRKLIESGDLGPVYGKQWRDFHGVDQIAAVLNSLREDPYSRRHIVSAWDPSTVDQAALPPCHSFFQFLVSERDGVKQLDVHLYQRSADLFLGVPFNIASYALLNNIVAHAVGMTPGTLYMSFGDLHLYTNHTEQAQVQASRTPKELPLLQIDHATAQSRGYLIPGLLPKYEISDFRLRDYNPYPVIKAEVAV